MWTRTPPEAKIDQYHYWITASGRVIHYTQLGDDHLLNILRWMKGVARTEKELWIAEGMYLLAVLDGDPVIRDIEKAIHALETCSSEEFIRNRWPIYYHLVSEGRKRGILGESFSGCFKSRKSYINED